MSIKLTKEDEGRLLRSCSKRVSQAASAVIVREVSSDICSVETVDGTMEWIMAKENLERMLSRGGYVRVIS